ncbi:MAG: protoheme IX farnesyltransferase [Chloroflexi bacterium]|nr:protoheme IX farnesyltransferase [Chloroflexota bacterium]
MALQPTSTPIQPSSLAVFVSDLVSLTKPRIIVLLLVTAVGAMFLAAQGPPSWSTTLLVIVGGTLGAGGANALNHYFDRDLDERMARTRWRPVPSGRIDARTALGFGILLNVVAFAVLATGVNLLSAVLTLGASAFYILVYTQWLKRTTTQNIVIGGAAGAFPPLIGWAAVTGDLGLSALYLFAIVFFWTPPHFWALALMIREDYEEAGVPMLPVVEGVPATTRSIMLYSLLLVTLSILFFSVDGLGWIYLAGALGLGSVFLYRAWRLLRSNALQDARGLYLYSLLYLALLFLMIVIDSSV